MSLPKETKNKMTREAYLEFEKNSEYKHEYFDGEIFAMVGASLNHNTINFNIATELGSQLKKGSACRGFTNDMRVNIPETTDYLYPDVVVTCDDVRLDEHDSLLNPILIIEILSESTEKYDRGLKFQSYRLVEPLQEYVLVSQDRCLVEVYRKKNQGAWEYWVYDDPAQTVTLKSIDCSLALVDMYHRVEFGDR